MTRARLYLGVDPGVAGGIAALDESGFVSAVSMPTTEADLLQVLRDLKGSTFQITAVLERVSASPQMGVSSSFSFGKGYGGLRMALVAVGIPFDEAVARRWQPIVGVVYPKDTAYGDRKRLARQRAQELFPGVTVTPPTADAILIAEYCRRCAVSPPAPATKKPRRRARPLLDDAPAADPASPSSRF